MQSGNTLVQIPCCVCGTMIYPNAANQCGTCLAQEFDLKAMLQRNGDMKIRQCRQCRRYERSEKVFEHAEPESPQLLSICLKHIPGLSSNKNYHNGHKSHAPSMHLVDASWVWTEPHSMRLKVRVTVRTELSNVPVQQRVMIEFVVQFHQCHDCKREFTNRTWQAVVQLRQKRDDGAPRKGLAALELALARNPNVRKHVLRIDSCRHGLDFYFLTVPHAQYFASFLAKLAPMRLKTSTKLVSTDSKNNTANIKHTLTCDMVPLCRDDLILLHSPDNSGSTHSRSILSGRLGLVTKVSSNVQIIDASPKRSGPLDSMDMNSEAYFKAGGDKAFPILFTAQRLTRFVVLDVELCDGDRRGGGGGGNDDDFPQYRGPNSGVSKFALADVQVVRESDFGVNDTVITCVSHLGHLLQPGDVVLGYDLEASSLSVSTSSRGVVDLDEVIHSKVVIPDVVLVKKVASGGDNAPRPVADNDDEPLRKPSGKRISKKKARRMEKRDRKRRELEESAARMGFLEDFDEDEEEEEDGEAFDMDAKAASGDFATQLEHDPELAAELEEVEQALASMNANETEMEPVDEEVEADDANIADEDDEDADLVNEGK